MPLGGKEITKTKAFFILFYILNLAFLYYLAIGATEAERTVIYYYVGLEVVSLVLIVAVDMLSYGKKELPYVDSVIHESNSPLSLKAQIALGTILSVFIGIWISSTGQAFVKANPFGVTFQIMETKVGKALLSALVGGVIETLFFFGLLYPSLHAFLEAKLGFPGTILAMFLGALIFTLYHNIVYETVETALYTVFFFGFVFNVLPVFFLRSLVIPTMLHFCNNFLIVYLNITKMMILF